MDWSIFAILQMFIITVGVSTALWLRIRAVNAQNALLREHLDAQPGASEAAGGANPEEWLQAKLGELGEDDTTAPVRRVVLEETLNASDDFQQKLSQAIQAAGLAGSEGGGDSAELQAKITSLEAELAAAQEGQESDHAEELKALLQQFTRDSREMMACIQTLEAENAELRAELENKSADDAGEDPDAESNPAESEEAELLTT